LRFSFFFFEAEPKTAKREVGQGTLVVSAWLLAKQQIHSILPKWQFHGGPRGSVALAPARARRVPCVPLSDVQSEHAVPYQERFKHTARRPLLSLVFGKRLQRELPVRFLVV
jgi:hypothetical protein